MTYQFNARDLSKPHRLNTAVFSAWIRMEAGTEVVLSNPGMRWRTEPGSEHLHIPTTCYDITFAPDRSEEHTSELQSH